MRKRRHVEEAEDLNLVPIMNLVTILIPFLLMSAQFVSLAIIDSSLPAISTEVVPTEEDTEEKLSLSVLISSEGFSLKGADSVLSEDDPELTPTVECHQEGCPSSDAYDYEGLKKRIVKIKERWPDEENVILVPGPYVPYEVLVLTMDTTRDDPEVKDADGKAKDLFPYVVIAGGVE